MLKLFAELEVGDTILVPYGASAAITIERKSGTKARVRIESSTMVTIKSAGGAERQLPNTPAITRDASAPQRQPLTLHRKML